MTDRSERSVKFLQPRRGRGAARRRPLCVWQQRVSSWGVLGTIRGVARSRERIDLNLDRKSSIKFIRRVQVSLELLVFDGLIAYYISCDSPAPFDPPRSTSGTATFRYIRHYWW